MQKKLSIVVPVYNEEEAISDFIERMLLPALKPYPNHEIIFINDGSKDKTLEILQKYSDKNKKIKVLAFSRNFGKEVALSAGMREATGDAVITIDADGQQPPELIPEFIKRWQKGAEIVTGVRGKFEKHGIIAKIGSKFFYKILRGLGARNTLPGSTDYRLVDRTVVDEFNKLTEHNRIHRGLIDWMGFKRENIYYKYGNRMAGKPSYNFKKLFKLAVDSFVSMSTTPLVIFGWIGAFIMVTSAILGVFVIIQQHILGDPMNLNWTGATQLGIFITFLVGLILISQAITAIYISHIHTETKGRPLYIIDKKSSRNLSEPKK